MVKWPSHGMAAVWTLLIAMLPALIGCGRGGVMGPGRTGLKASDYFDDSKVVELCQAIQRGDQAEVKRLIDAGVDLNAKGRDQVTPLLFAILEEQLPIFEMLLEQGADPNVIVKKHVQAKYAFAFLGASVTHIAAKATSGEYFTAVMKHRGDPSLVSPWMHYSTLHAVVMGAASLDEKTRRARVLREAGANLDLQEEGGSTAAMMAMGWAGQYELALELLEMGTNPRIRNNNNLSVVHMCISDTMMGAGVPAQRRPAFDALVDWLEENGPSFQEARDDIARWSKWPTWDIKKFAELRDAEIAERKRREELEKGQ